MNALIKRLLYKIPMKVYSLSGRSGTGKSFRAQFIASKYHIKLIIDDGLLIRGSEILAGKSAKQEENFLTAVKRALFKDENHRNEILEAMGKYPYRKILIIGTSDKMVSQIATRLNLPQPKVFIHIEDIATEDEINTAMRIRYTEGKHIIPVPPLQVTRKYGSIVYDSIKVKFLKKTAENTLVKPQFKTDKDENGLISEAAVLQMIKQVLDEYESSIKVQKVNCSYGKEGYILKVFIRTPEYLDEETVLGLKRYISDSLERYAGIYVENADLVIESWS